MLCLQPLVKFKSHLYYEDKDQVSEAEKNLKESDGGQVRQQLVTSQRRCVIATVADTSTLRLLLYTDNSVQERRQAGRGVQQHLRGHLLPGHLALQERIGECHLPHVPGHRALHERIGGCRLMAQLTVKFFGELSIV